MRKRIASFVSGAVGRTVLVGLKVIKSSQTYPLPAGRPFERYGSVVV